MQQLRWSTVFVCLGLRQTQVFEGDELADNTAKAGAIPLNHVKYWTRFLAIRAWGELDFVSFLQVAVGPLEIVASGSVAASRLAGADYLPRTSVEGMSVPSLDFITNDV